MQDSEDMENMDGSFDEEDDTIHIDDLDEEIEFVPVNEFGVEEKNDESEEVDEAEKLRVEIEESRDEYIRLYAEFENYKKRIAKDKEELARYANENILHELLPSVDNLEIAIKHADDENTNKSFLEGVQMTLRELYRTFEKFGVKPIEAEGKAFDPEYHHAVAHVERDDMEENMVVAELRKGFTYNDKVLRASMVSVSKSPSGDAPEEDNIDE
jgi:molecular chaperone GrpE